MARPVSARSGTVLILCLLTLAAGAARAGGPLRVVASDAQGLRVAVADLTPRWGEPGPDGRAALDVPGFVPGGAPGAPRLPAFAAWVLVPPGTRPQLEVRSENWRDAGGRRLDLASVPAARPDPDTGEPRPVGLALEPGQPVPPGYEVTPEVAAARARGNAPRTGPAASLGEVAWWRGRRVAALRVVPVRHDAAGAALATLAAGEWEVRFVPEAAPAPAEVPSRRLETRGDEHFGGAFLNPEMLRRQPTEAAALGLAPERRPAGAKSAGKATLLAPEIRLGVPDTRLFRVTASRLRDEGLLPNVPVQESEVRLYLRRYVPALDDGSGAPPYAEVEVPIHMVGDGGLFEGDDFFVFYGLRLRDDTGPEADIGNGPETLPACDDLREWNNPVNVYWLAAARPEGTESWARMPVDNLQPALGQPLPRYRRTEVHEEQLAFRDQHIQEGGDRTYYNHYFDSSVSVSMSPQWSPDTSAGAAAASVTVRASAWNNVLDPTVYVDLVRDGNDAGAVRLGSLYVSALGDYNYPLPAVAPSLLDAGTAKLVFTSNSGFIASYLDRVTIAYDALYRARNRRLAFHTGNQAGSRPIVVTNFPDPDIGLVEVTDPYHPVFYDTAANVVDGGGGTWNLSIQPDQASAAATRSFRAVSSFTGLGVGEFDYNQSEVAEDPASPVAAGSDPDLLVITHRQFEQPLQRWLDHRRARAAGDLAIRTVRVRDVYDWYGGGLRSPEAVRRFVEHARDQWNTWSLVIVGDANENALQLDVRAEARAFARDWVPTHYHVQYALTNVWELMATDKWYVTAEPSSFPDNVRSPWEMLTGRFPVNSAAELNAVIDKVVRMEATAPGQAWRRRGIFLADDTWSDGYGVDVGDFLRYDADDETFLESERDLVSVPWATATPAPLVSDLLTLRETLESAYSYDDQSATRSPGEVRNYVQNSGPLATLRAHLNAGGLLAHYQGHANARVLASEFWFKDDISRRDVSALTNAAAPWVFFGMGCHVSDWAQDTVTLGTGVKEQSLGEKLLVQSSGSGACATYGSSGYEYIDWIGSYCGFMMDRWLNRPPTTGPGGAHRSRWVLGELFWATESDVLAAYGNDQNFREMCTQFVLLGDPLMRLDAGAPVVTATLQGEGGGEVSGETGGELDLVGLDATNQRTVTVAARDEAGIDRLRVTDSTGADLTSMVTVTADSLPPGETDQQEAHWRLGVPVRPFGHTIAVEVWDTGAPLAEDRHWTLTLNVAQEAELLAGGEPVDPQTFEFEPDVPVDFTMTVSSAAVLDAGLSFVVRSADPDNLVLTNTSVTYVDPRTLHVSFTATAPAGTTGERAIVLVIDDRYETTWVLQAGEQNVPAVGISRVFNFPNPMGSQTRFVFETAAAPCRGTIRVFSTAGRTVARIPVQHEGGGSGVAAWDGRDGEGDRLANGTYLYRVELDAPGGRIVSPVQRLVVMH